jgi:orotate phosphoribosyltransferase
MATDSRTQLINLLAQRSFQLGEFKLSSGRASDYYIDCRATTLHAEGARLTGSVILDFIRDRKWQPRAIGGLTMGADPIVTAVSLLSAQQIIARAPARTKSIDPTDWHIHGFLVRKTEKAHGTGQRIEGFREKPARVVIVDDVCTTGSSSIQAIEAAEDFGFDIAGVICLVEREEAGGRPAVEAAAKGAPFVSMFTAREIREVHCKLQSAAAAGSNQ